MFCSLTERQHILFIGHFNNYNPTNLRLVHRYIIYYIIISNYLSSLYYLACACQLRRSAKTFWQVMLAGLFTNVLLTH